MKNKFYPVLLLIFFSILFVAEVYAGPPGPPMGGGGPGCWPPETCNVPIDGGLSFLIAAGAGLAGKKFYDHRKKERLNK